MPEAFHARFPLSVESSKVTCFAARLSAEDVSACNRRSRSSSSHASKNPVVPRVFGFWNVSWTCRSNFLELFPKNVRGHSILTKTITLLRKLPCWIMRDVISTNMSRILWTARQSVYFSKSVKCKSLIGHVRREKKSFNVSPQSLIPSLVPKPVRAIRVTRGSFPDKLNRWRHILNRRGRLGTRLPHSVFSLDPELCLTARAYLNAQKHGLFHSPPSLLLNNEIFEYRRSKKGRCDSFVMASVL